ncbi:TPA: hypothetical protein POB35_005302 [Escherichia coli]|nr:hypothetical protein [Escherichia coli]EFA7487728.1 hypothetical protein [Escherichia coli]EFM9255930.1 hypothetical protein [Escherichia coli]EFO3034894.1 hypothetical protein [Escherichia coli]EGM7142080.1 hypothetical protein [Escherichia coli]EGO7941007.1 hypothetical protein [Escherichia coli]
MNPFIISTPVVAVYGKDSESRIVALTVLLNHYLQGAITGSSRVVSGGNGKLFCQAPAGLADTEPECRYQMIEQFMPKFYTVRDGELQIIKQRE